MRPLVAEGRKHHLDWLRVLAFGLLIPFHAGMLYNSWSFPLKSPRLVPELDWLLMLSTPWRLALVFLISGVASHFLIAKLGPGPFAHDRVRRLLPVIFFGMLVVNAPQTWIVATANGMTRSGIGEFWWAYLRNDQSVLKPPGMAMPRWDHLWFLLYLLPYALLFALWRKLRGERQMPSVPLIGLLLAPAIWLVVTNMAVDKILPGTDNVFNDWGQHLKWSGCFLTGVMLAPRADAWRWMEKWRRVSLGLCFLLGAMLLAAHALWLHNAIPSPWSWISYDVFSGLFAWGTILAGCGYAARYLNRPSPQLSYLNTAILPVYVLHQPLLFLAAFAIFPLRLPLAVEATILIAFTMLGGLVIYHFAIRPFRIMRFSFGLRQPASRPQLYALD
jgi:glucans biosynthesis protein C